MTDAPEPPASALAPGARCAVHPELAAESTCARCGNYMCRTCLGDGAFGLCISCQQRPGAGAFPLDREHYRLASLFTHAIARFKQHWLPLVLTFGGFFALVYSVALIGGFAVGVSRPIRSGPPGNVFTGGFVALQVVQVLLQIALQLPLLGLFVDVVEGKPPAIGAAFNRLRRLPAALLQMLIIYLVSGFAAIVLVALGFAIIKLTGTNANPPWLLFGIGGLIALIPLIYLGLGTMFGMLELVYNPSASALGALRTSFQLVDGQRWPVLGISLLSAAIALAGGLACCVGIFASMPFATLLVCSLFLALRNDGPKR